MRWVHLFCIATAALIQGCGLGLQYPDFSAKQYRLEGVRTLPGTNISGPAVFFRDHEHLRYEGVTDQHGIATILYDPSRKAAFLLDGANSRRRQFAGPAAPRIALQLSEGDIPQPLEMAWAALGPDGARATGRCRIAGERGGLWRTREPVAPNVIRTACITPDGIVLQLTENDVVLFRATSVRRGAQRNALFEIPETYQIIDNAELAQTGEPPTRAAPTGEALTGG